MTRTPTHLAALLALGAVAACHAVPAAAPVTTPRPAASAPAAAPAQGLLSGIEKARADSTRLPWTAADVHFMSAMIGHHAQAIRISRWVPSHGASASVRTLADRIINAQQDEIATMQTWLRDRRQPVPQPDTAGTAAMAMPMSMSGADSGGHAMAGHDMSGHDMSAMMPGMLSEAQLKQLDAARGAEFDRLFLTFMIQHHRGAITMVQQLFGTYGAGQDETVFKFASDVNVDQTTEVARMQRMLFSLALGAGSP